MVILQAMQVYIHLLKSVASTSKNLKEQVASVKRLMPFFNSTVIS